MTTEHRITAAEERSDRITRILAACVIRNKTPSSIGFADFIAQVCYKYFGFDVTRRTTREYTDALIGCWHDDLWRSRVSENPYLSDEQKQGWAERVNMK
ncbi:MAG: hypothetical protein ABSD42_06655 [Candidatus Bathyarchaeia archaeon]|jgi:hypothetical protein